jgi:CRISPR-associated endoribonuclease Cas6
MSEDGRPIFKTSGDHAKHIVLESANIYKFYISFSHEDMMLDVAKALAEKRNLKLFNTEVYISDAIVNVKHLSELRLELGKSFHIHFLSPTMFAVSGGMQRLLPLPSLVFGSILKHWNTYAPSYLKMDWSKTIKRVERGVFEVDYNIHPVTVSYGRSADGRPQSIRGFIGWCMYQVKDPSLIEVCERLLAYGEYVGVGKSRSMGMGMISAKPAFSDRHTQKEPP